MEVEEKLAKSMDGAVEAITSENTSISLKMRNLFYLRSLQSPHASLCIQKCLSRDSVLLDHEVAYVLGQMKQPNSVDFLLEIAKDHSINDIVRHEAIEALGNFEDPGFAEHIKVYLAENNPIIRESAALALKKLQDGSENQNKIGRFGSRDPAYPFEGEFNEAVRLFSSDSIMDKYRAIFYFRDLNNKESVEMLAKGFDDPSELLRHEIAYVFGQMQNELATDALIKVLDNANEKDIVRHEAAEALGNIGTERCTDALEKYLNSDIKILRESAEVGLGISAFADRDDEYLNID